MTPCTAAEYTNAVYRAYKENNMPQIGRSVKLYQERRMPQYMPTLRGPGPRIFLPDNPVNHLPLEAPLPASQFLYNRKYVDGGKTAPWPSGTCGNCK